MDLETMLPFLPALRKMLMISVLVMCGMALNHSLSVTLVESSMTSQGMSWEMSGEWVLPCSPISLVVGITTEALELYRVAHIRSPHLSIQAFVKTMRDLHGELLTKHMQVEFHRHLSHQFSIAFDVYLQIKQSIAVMISKSLRRDSPNWCLKHTCPACSYVLADEEQLTFKMLYAMDGNDSLKRVIRRTLDNDNDDSQAVGVSSELPTGQLLTSNRYLSRSFVDQFSRTHHQLQNTPGENLCEGWWKNMDDTKTKKAWGIYDETGIFVAVCHHGFCLLIADMVQSGELAKYPLAVVARLLNVFGDNLGGGYDIGCQFKTTLENSFLGPLIRSLHHTCLVGAFHGHAHRHLCQLSSLTTYIKGLGLEDLETCERTFSKSNSPASALHYTSVFHRQQAIASYFDHNDDFEVYGNLCNQLSPQQLQASPDILANGDATLSKVMQDLRVRDVSVFECWLDEEKAYLKGLTREPEEETLQMEYWQRLVNLSASSLALHAAVSIFTMDSHQDTASYDTQVRTMRKAKSARRHAVEDYKRNLKFIQALECKLEWQKVGRLIANRRYQRALDHLESLVIARIFELTRMSRAGTGYKLRKHIAKALQTRSVAIKSALNTYNSIVSAMSTPRQTLQWEEVVNYAFLADADLLRSMRADVSLLPWSSPASCSAMDLYFNTCRAREEISHLNDNYLWACEDQLKFSSPALANQLAIHRNTQGRFNTRHLKRLHDISMLPGFSGTLVPDTHEDLDEEEQEEEIAEEASRNLQDVLLVMDDFARLGLLDDADMDE
ncbi:hypothetical protein BDR05DRAFT_978479 [Suillus weaverae]|nr:hypothetical protein BDR05DRAFT_978479 [Suillus weaverae]